MSLELYRPAVGDLWFKRDLLAGEATMSYNCAWGGTIDFPEELWGRWHDAWVVREGEGRRYYRYLRDSDTGEFVGEVAYRWDPEYDSFITDVLMHARFRGRGYGGAGLELLCGVARERGTTTLRDNVALDNPAMWSLTSGIVGHPPPDRRGRRRLQPPAVLLPRRRGRGDPAALGLRREGRG